MVVGVDERLAALSLVREGRLYDLGRVLDEHAPVFPGRHFRQLLVANTAPIGGLSWTADVVSTTTQVGTHVDALCHLSEDGRIHGGHAVADVAGPSGKVQSKLPLVFVFVSFIFVPFAPQLVVTEDTVSVPGSLIV